jgi:hypothetical protein
VQNRCLKIEYHKHGIGQIASGDEGDA